MTKPACEVMDSRPSPELDGWEQWGIINDLGEFTALWGLQSGNSPREAMYELDAAGICDIRGKDQMGQPKPIEETEIALAEAGQAVETQVATESPVSSESQPPTWAQLAPWQYGGLIVFGVVGLIWLAVVQSKRTKATDETPAPTYKQNPFGGR